MGYYNITADCGCEIEIQIDYNWMDGVIEAGYCRVIKHCEDWISVEKRLPDPESIVLVCDLSSDINKAYYDVGEFFVDGENMTKYITHWMPMIGLPRLL